MKDKLIKVLLDNDDDNEDMLDRLQDLMNELPKESPARKTISNLHQYLKYIADNDIDMLEDLADSHVGMDAASLRAVGFINDSSRDEQLTSLILQSSMQAWVLAREFMSEEPERNN